MPKRLFVYISYSAAYWQHSVSKNDHVNRAGAVCKADVEKSKDSKRIEKHNIHLVMSFVALICGRNKLQIKIMELNVICFDWDSCSCCTWTQQLGQRFSAIYFNPCAGIVPNFHIFHFICFQVRKLIIVVSVSSYDVTANTDKG